MRGITGSPFGVGSRPEMLRNQGRPESEQVDAFGQKNDAPGKVFGDAESVGSDGYEVILLHTGVRGKASNLPAPLGGQNNPVESCDRGED